MAIRRLAKCKRSSLCWRYMIDLAIAHQIVYQEQEKSKICVSDEADHDLRCSVSYRPRVGQRSYKPQYLICRYPLPEGQLDAAYSRMDGTAPLSVSIGDGLKDL